MNREQMSQITLHYSDLKNLEKSVGHFLYAKENPTEQTPAMARGSALHTLVLQPELFDGKYIMLPADAPKKPTKTQLNAKKPSQDTLDAIAWWQNFDTIRDGRTMINAEDMKTLRDMATALKEHTAANALLTAESNTYEQKHKWTLEYAKSQFVACESTLDVENNKMDAVVDIKTIDSIDPQSVERAIINYKYYWQDAFYRQTYQTLHGRDCSFFFVFVESEPPHGVIVVALTDIWYATAMKQIRHLAKKWDDFLTGRTNFSGVSQTLHILQMPAYLDNKVLY
jgi:hypothetical protein